MNSEVTSERPATIILDRRLIDRSGAGCGKCGSLIGALLPPCSCEGTPVVEDRMQVHAELCSEIRKWDYGEDDGHYPTWVGYLADHLLDSGYRRV